jgi:hypothetical protein
MAKHRQIFFLAAFTRDSGRLRCRSDLFRRCAGTALPSVLSSRLRGPPDRGSADLDADYARSLLDLNSGHHAQFWAKHPKRHHL